MSKLIEEIRAEATGMRRAVWKPRMPLIAFSESAAPVEYDYDLEYRFTAEFGTRQFCSVEDVEYVREAVCHRVADAVFGEFRAPLLEAKHSAYTHGDRKTADIIATILQQMFDIHGAS